MYLMSGHKFEETVKPLWAANFENLIKTKTFVEEMLVHVYCDQYLTITDFAVFFSVKQNT